MKEVYLKCDMIPYERRSVNALIDRLYTITQSNYRALSGNVIWFELLDRLGVESEKEILDAFGINDLKSKIYNITNIGLCQDIESMCAYLMFKIDDSVKCGTECVAKDISDIYAYINKIETNSQLKANIEVTTDGASVNCYKESNRIGGPSMCDKRKMSNWTVTERDLEIFNRWQSGDSVHMIAMDEYVSTQRIYEIITKVRLFRGKEVYKDPYDLRYLQSITPRTRKFLVKRGAKDIKELIEWVKYNRLTTIPGIGDTIEKKILIQLNDFMRQRREEEQNKNGGI